jgi:hypothetical protein
MSKITKIKGLEESIWLEIKYNNLNTIYAELNLANPSLEYIGKVTTFFASVGFENFGAIYDLGYYDSVSNIRLEMYHPDAKAFKALLMEE